jgi:hypothetical protein
MSTSHTRRSLISAAAAVISEAAIKVPQKFIDHARAVGSTLLFAELTYRNWKPRGLTDQQILDKITKHGEEQKKEEAVIVDESVEELDEAYDINAETRKIELALATLRESFKGFSPFYKELVKKDKANEKILLAMLKHIRDTESLLDDIVFSDLKKGKFSEE